jgi:hypothetical protein
MTRRGKMAALTLALTPRHLFALICRLPSNLHARLRVALRVILGRRYVWVVRPVKTAWILVGAVGWACGGSSQDGLFKGTTTGCTSGSQCNFGATPGAGGGTGGGFTSSGGGSATGGFTGTGAESATGGFLGTGATNATGGTFGSGGAGTGGVSGSGTGGRSSGGVPQLFPDAGRGGTGGTSFVCPTGHFTGMLQGPYTSLTGTREIGASIDFSVNINGSVTGTFTGPGPSKATLNGSVDCSTGVLTVNIENGTYPGVLGGTTKFSGTLGGQYNVDANAFVQGTWTITESSNKSNGGTGTWS